MTSLFVRYDILDTISVGTRDRGRGGEGKSIATTVQGSQSTLSGMNVQSGPISMHMFVFIYRFACVFDQETTAIPRVSINR